MNKRLPLVAIGFFLAAVFAPTEWLVPGSVTGANREPVLGELPVPATRHSPSSDGNDLDAAASLTRAADADSGAHLEAVLQADYQPTCMAAGEDGIWWTDSLSGGIWKTQFGSHESKVAVPHAGQVSAIAVTRGALAWINDKGVFVRDLRTSQDRRVHGHLDTREVAVAFWQGQLFFSDGLDIWIAEGSQSPSRRISDAWRDNDVVRRPMRTLLVPDEFELYWGAEGTVLWWSRPEHSFIQLGSFGDELGMGTQEIDVAGVTARGGRVVYALVNGKIFWASRSPIPADDELPPGPTILLRGPWEQKETDVHSGIQALTGDARVVFWAEIARGGSTVQRAPIEGGDATLFARLRGAVAQMVVAEERLWITMPGQGALVAIDYH